LKMRTETCASLSSDILYELEANLNVNNARKFLHSIQ